jgi:hypothetical protein
MTSSNLPEGFRSFPKYPDKLAVARDGRVFNVESQHMMLPWENEEDGGRLYISLRVSSTPEKHRDIEISVEELILQTFKESA